MSELPKGWVAVTIEDLGSVSSGFGFPKHLQGRASGDLPFAKVRDISHAHLSNGGRLAGANHYVSHMDLPALKARPVTAGSIAFAKIGEALRLNRRVLLEVDAILDNNCMAITPDIRLVAPEFLHRFMTTIDLSPFAVATTVPSVRKGDVESIDLGLPPLAEQKRIVAKLDALATKSARARTDLARIDTLVTRYKQAVLSKAFSGELTKDWRINQNLESWIVSSPADLLQWSSGKNLPSRDYGGGEIPVIGGNGISGYHDVALIDFPTIVIGRVGALCGNVYHSQGPAWITDNAIYAKWVSPNLDLEYATLAYAVADLNKLSGGTGQPYVNQTILNSIAFSLPSIDEQKEIVRRIESAFQKIDRLTAEAKRALELVGKLDEAILAKAFKGQFVPQDPNDEPASALLERIKAERAAASKAKRGRRKKA